MGGKEREGQGADGKDNRREEGGKEWEGKGALVGGSGGEGGGGV